MDQNTSDVLSEIWDIINIISPSRTQTIGLEGGKEARNHISQSTPDALIPSTLPTPAPGKWTTILSLSKGFM